MVCRKSSQNTNMIFLIPHASWDGRVSLTLFWAAFSSVHRLLGENAFLEVFLVGWGDGDFFVVFFFSTLFFVLGAVSGENGDAGSFTPSVISLTMGDTSTCPREETHHSATSLLLLLFTSTSTLSSGELGFALLLPAFCRVVGWKATVVLDDIDDTVGFSFQCNGTSP